jgi:two-component system invasion response regulator UvrY
VHRVLLVDDHRLVREGFALILKASGLASSVDQASSGPEALRLAAKQAYDLAVLDVGLPGRSGIELLGDLRSLQPDLRALVVSMFPEEQYGLRAIRAGAGGYLRKDAEPEELVRAARAVAAGKRWITPALAEQLAIGIGQDRGDAPAHQQLSDRELQVLRGYGQGQGATVIAQQLKLSPKTVATYRSRILNKLGLDSTAAMIRYAVEHGLVEPRGDGL